MSANKVEINNAATEKNKPSRPVLWGNVGILFSGFGIVVLIIVMGIASYSLLAVNGKFVMSLSSLTNRFSETQNLLGNMQKAVMDLQQTTQQIDNTVKNHQQTIIDLQKIQHSSKADFLLAEAYYLIKLAQDNLQYENNVALALKLMQSAEQEIASLNDSTVYSIREALASDLVILQHAPQVNVASVYTRLSVLGDQIDKLPLRNVFSNEQAQHPVEKNDEKAVWWRRGLNTMSQVLQRIVIVHKNQSNLPPFITPDQQTFLFQNLHAELEQVKWGLLHHQSEVYRRGLQQMAKWIKQYAIQDAAATQQTLLDLQQLEQIDVYPLAPSVSHTLQAFQVYLNKVSQ